MMDSILKEIAPKTKLIKYIYKKVCMLILGVIYSELVVEKEQITCSSMI